MGEIITDYGFISGYLRYSLLACKFIACLLYSFSSLCYHEESYELYTDLLLRRVYLLKSEVNETKIDRID